MLEFDPPPMFRPTYELYPELWTIVTSPTACLGMRMAAILEQPAVHNFHEIPDLVNFLAYVDAHDPDSSNGVRALIGYMCARVMEHFDYELIEKDVPLLDSTLFQSGARYRQKS